MHRLQVTPHDCPACRHCGADGLNWFLALGRERPVARTGFCPKCRLLTADAPPGYLFPPARLVGLYSKAPEVELAQVLSARIGLDPGAQCYAMASQADNERVVLRPMSAMADDPAGTRPKPALVFAGDHLAQLADLKSTLLTLGGFSALLVADVPYLGAALSDLALDRLCASPQPALSLVALEPLLAAAGLRPFDAEPLSEGWLRLYAAPARQTRPERVGLMRIRQAEAAARLDRADGFADFAPRFDRALVGLSDFLTSARHGRKSVAAIGSAPAARLLAMAGAIAPGDLTFLVLTDHQDGDDQAGLPTPVAGPAELRRRRPDFLLILPGQDRAQVLAECADLRRLGTCFVAAFPTVTLIA